MVVLNKPDMNYGVWAEGGNIEIPSSEKVEEGWVVEKPLNETMNWLQNRQDKMLQYLNQRGIAEWDIRTEYPANALTAREGVVYQALSTNIDSDPTLNTGIWKIAFVSYLDFIDYSETVNSITGTDKFLDFYVAKSEPVMDAAAKGVAYNDSTGVSGYGFEGTTPKVTNTGNTVVEFSGGTSPKDVVTHEQLALAIQNYKVGDIYITVADGSPSTRLGYGTWERFGRGRTLVGFTDEVSNDIPEWTKISGSRFGEYNHKLIVAEMPSHSHRLQHGRDNGSTDNNAGTVATDTEKWSGQWIQNPQVENTGGDQPHNNVQPSIVVYFWKRVA